MNDENRMKTAPTPKGHTPGPWHIAASGIAFNGSYGFEMIPWGADIPISDADKRLIAAAPETAAERDRLKKQIEQMFKDGDYVVAEARRLKGECEALRAALDKLTREMMVRQGYDDPTPPRWFSPRIAQARAALAKGGAK